MSAVLAAASVAVAPAQAAVASTPGEDSFYTPPSSLNGRPGDVIRSRSSVFTLAPIIKTPYPGVKSWQVMYQTQSGTGEPIAVTGTVLVPTKAWTGGGDRPLVSYGVGTRGLGDDCAPSYTMSQGTDYEGLFITSALSQGWAVAITDMQGLGTPGMHTYEVGKAQGRAVLDMARAALKLEGTGLNARTPVGLMGYSQGGTSVGWAAQLAGSYAPELNLKGVAAGGVPADLIAVADHLDGNMALAFAFMAAVGFDAAYPELNLEGYLNDRGRQLLQKAQDVCLTSIDGVTTLIDTAFDDIADYVTTNPLETEVWRNRLNEHRLGSVRPGVPVLQYQGRIDNIIPYGQAATLRQDWCRLGANLTWRPDPIGTHVTGMVAYLPQATSFLADRFAGRPTSGNC
ncbi:lipase family protein [Thermomonospora amylolytica]|uniref:lipase family protein n=1 Tax=Thermomonospora amylolytica TaxID=1411117 RepID=UPI001F32177B|nr:lipase family protein [Thermomonospora amylolytica]